MILLICAKTSTYADCLVLMWSEGILSGDSVLWVNLNLHLFTYKHTYIKRAELVSQVPRLSKHFEASTAHPHPHPTVCVCVSVCLCTGPDWTCRPICELFIYCTVCLLALASVLCHSVACVIPHKVMELVYLVVCNDDESWWHRCW